MAASALLHSCATVDHAGSGEEIKNAAFNMDHAKSIFATRFAICEISEAKGQIPNSCASFLPNKQNTRKQGFMGRFTDKGPTKPSIVYPFYEASTEHSLDDCRAALEGRPQWWTSYSNSRQNAVSLCHAVRGEIEKDESLHLHRVLAETTVDLAEALRHSKAEATETMAAFHELRVNIRQFHLALFDQDKEKRSGV